MTNQSLRFIRLTRYLWVLWRWEAHLGYGAEPNRGITFTKAGAFRKISNDYGHFTDIRYR